MIGVKIQGGLGNQMFQYAIGRYLSLTTNSELLLDINHFSQNTKAVKRNFELDIFNVHYTFCTNDHIKQILGNNIFSKINNFALKFSINLIPNYIKEKHFHFDKQVLTSSKNIYLDGYWQSPKYFEGISQTIKNDFLFKETILDENKSMADLITQHLSVALHIRRGDYVNNPLHDVFDMNYIKKALHTMYEYIGKDFYVFIFSDDIAWCKRNLEKIYPNAIKIYCNGGSSKEDLHLMSLCKHFIIANSSFSWWAAWLGNHENKIVISPVKWFNDTKINTSNIYPSDWIKL